MNVLRAEWINMAKVQTSWKEAICCRALLRSPALRAGKTQACAVALWNKSFEGEINFYLQNKDFFFLKYHNVLKPLK